MSNNLNLGFGLNYCPNDYIVPLTGFGNPVLTNNNI